MTATAIKNDLLINSPFLWAHLVKAVNNKQLGNKRLNYDDDTKLGSFHTGERDVVVSAKLVKSNSFVMGPDHIFYDANPNFIKSPGYIESGSKDKSLHESLINTAQLNGELSNWQKLVEESLDPAGSQSFSNYLEINTESEDGKSKITLKPHLMEAEIYYVGGLAGFDTGSAHIAYDGEIQYEDELSKRREPELRNHLNAAFMALNQREIFGGHDFFKTRVES